MIDVATKDAFTPIVPKIAEISPDLAKLFEDLLMGEIEVDDIEKKAKVKITKYREMIDIIPSRIYQPMGRSVIIDWDHIMLLDGKLDVGKDFAQFFSNDTNAFIEDLEAILLNCMVKIHSEEILLTKKHFYVRFRGRDPHVKGVEQIRSDSVEHLVSFQGFVTKVSQPKEILTNGVYVCKTCGMEYEFPQPDISQYTAPPPCMNEKCEDFGKKSLNLNRNKSKFVEIQQLYLQEDTSITNRKQAYTVQCVLIDDAVDCVDPGDMVIGTGILKTTPMKGFKLSADSFDYPRFDQHLLVSHVEIKSDQSEKIEYDAKELDEIGKRPDVWEYVWQSLAPGIYGNQTIDNVKKVAMMMTIAGRIGEQVEEQVKRRSNIHMLLVGDPGTAKTYIARALRHFCPRYQYASAKSASGVGITAAVVKDEFSESYTVQAGSIVLASGGVAPIDELEKMDVRDIDMLHEAMESGKLTLRKGGLFKELRAETNIFGIANPTSGRYNPDEELGQNIKGLKPSLLSRFDYIFVMKDMDVSVDASVHRELDEKISDRVLHLDDEGKEDRDRTRKVRAYLQRCKINAEQKPITLPIDIRKRLKEYYIKIRSTAYGKRNAPIPITARFLESLIRSTITIACIRNHEACTMEDAEEIISIMQHSIDQTLLTADGKYDSAIVEHGRSMSSEKELRDYCEIIVDLAHDFKYKFTDEDLRARLIADGIAKNDVKAVKICKRIHEEGLLKLHGDTITGLSEKGKRLIGFKEKKAAPKSEDVSFTDDDLPEM